jgi:hypothetical protein
VKWTITYDNTFFEDVLELTSEVRVELLARVERLAEMGPHTKRPLVDTLKGSKHANMKELRFDADGGVWRIAFAFDPERNGILLVGGDKSGGSEKAFYKGLIKIADKRFDAHLKNLER